MPAESNPRKFYYDANALEGEAVLREIINLEKRYSTIAVTSHLSLGEAFGSCRRKGIEKLAAFYELITALGSYIAIEGNDGAQEIDDELRSTFSALSETDRLHIATAIKHKCAQFHTADSGIISLPKKKLRQLAERYGCYDFTIIPKNFS